MNEKRTTNRKIREGTVISAAMEKTVVVELERLMRHPQYGKVIRKSKRVKVHDENKECKVGDRIRIMETRPLSKTKRWRYLETVRKAEVV